MDQPIFEMIVEIGNYMHNSEPGRQRQTLKVMLYQSAENWLKGEVGNTETPILAEFLITIISKRTGISCSLKQNTRLLINALIML